MERSGILGKLPEKDQNRLQPVAEFYLLRINLAIVRKRISVVQR